MMSGSNDHLSVGEADDASYLLAHRLVEFEKFLLNFLTPIPWIEVVYQIPKITPRECGVFFKYVKEKFARFLS